MFQSLLRSHSFTVSLSQLTLSADANQSGLRPMKHSRDSGLIQNRQHRLIRGAFISLLVVASFGCSSPITVNTDGTEEATATSTARPSKTAIAFPRLAKTQPIAQLLTADPTTVVDTSVYLSGTIVQQVPLVEGRLYELRDESGSIWVMAASESEALITGNNIQVQGIVAYETIAIAGQEQGELYIQQQQIFD